MHAHPSGNEPLILFILITFPVRPVRCIRYLVRQLKKDFGDAKSFSSLSLFCLQGVWLKWIWKGIYHRLRLVFGNHWVLWTSSRIGPYRVLTGGFYFVLLYFRQGHNCIGLEEYYILLNMITCCHRLSERLHFVCWTFTRTSHFDDFSIYPTDDNMQWTETTVLRRDSLCSATLTDYYIFEYRLFLSVFCYLKRC